MPRLSRRRPKFISAARPLRVRAALVVARSVLGDEVGLPPPRPGVSCVRSGSVCGTCRSDLGVSDRALVSCFELASLEREVVPSALRAWQHSLTAAVTVGVRCRLGGPMNSTIVCFRGASMPEVVERSCRPTGNRACRVVWVVDVGRRATRSRAGPWCVEIVGQQPESVASARPGDSVGLFLLGAPARSSAGFQ